MCLLRNAIKHTRLLSQEAFHTPGCIEKVQCDGVCHDLAHHAHHAILEHLLRVGMPSRERHPCFQGHAGHSHLGHADDAVRGRRAQAPGRAARLHVATIGEAQDHFLAFLVGDDALEDPVEDEILLHLAHALVQQHVALVAVADGQMRLEFGPIFLLQTLEDDVLLQLQYRGNRTCSMSLTKSSELPMQLAPFVAFAFAALQAPVDDLDSWLRLEKCRHHLHAHSHALHSRSEGSKMNRWLIGASFAVLAPFAWAVPSVAQVEAEFRQGHYAQAESMMQEVAVARPQSVRAHLRVRGNPGP